jgi:hypothetical protein
VMPRARRHEGIYSGRSSSAPTHTTTMENQLPFYRSSRLRIMFHLLLRPRRFRRATNSTSDLINQVAALPNRLSPGARI